MKNGIVARLQVQVFQEPNISTNKKVVCLFFSSQGWSKWQREAGKENSEFTTTVVSGGFLVFVIASIFKCVSQHVYIETIQMCAEVESCISQSLHYISAYRALLIFQYLEIHFSIFKTLNIEYLKKM